MCVGSIVEILFVVPIVVIIILLVGFRLIIWVRVLSRRDRTIRIIVVCLLKNACRLLVEVVRVLLVSVISSWVSVFRSVPRDVPTIFWKMVCASTCWARLDFFYRYRCEFFLIRFLSVTLFDKHALVCEF